MSPIFTIASASVGEAIRRKVLLIILLLSVGLIITAPMLGVLSARSETSVLTSFILAVVQLSSAVIAITLTVYMIPNEVERRTIYTILSKPVLRHQFVLGKYLGAVAALALMMGLMAVVSSITWILFQSDKSQIPSMLAGFGMYFIQMSILTAICITLSTFVPPIVNFFVSGSIYLVGSLGFTFYESIRDSQTVGQFSKLLATILTSVLPNFAIFNVQNKIVNPTAQITDPSKYAISGVLYGLLYTAVVLIIGMIIFERREV
jgi:ABC-type transport system involved in multi-copper enzyme maturation permease subunit